MKKIVAILISLIMIKSNVSATQVKFNDIEGHWAEGVIIKWKNVGYINGYLDGSFKPDNPITRAELSKVLSAAFELQEEEIDYDDVYENEWYYSCVKKSSRYIPMYSLVTLYESNKPYNENRGKNVFLPEVKAIRMHVAEALVKIKIEKENIIVNDLSIKEIHQKVTSVYKDGDLNNLYSMHGTVPSNVERMNRYAWLSYEFGIMVGNNGFFYPYEYMTRAELLTVIDRMLK